MARLSAAIEAYGTTYRRTRSDLPAFNAAVEAYLAKHPDVSDQSARRIVSQQIALAIEEGGPKRFLAR